MTVRLSAGHGRPRLGREMGAQWSVMEPLQQAYLCVESMRLLKEYANAVSECHRMQTAQLVAVRNGENFPFEEEIAKAAIRRENVKYAILAHREEHGC